MPAEEYANPSRPLVQAEDVRVRAESVEVLKGITLQAHRGEILSVIGPAGAGKTTFLRCLNRMAEMDPDIEVSGTILLDGVPTNDGSVDVAMLRRQVGTVFSVPIPLPTSIRGNISFGLDLMGLPRRLQAERLETALRAAYLWDEVKDRLDEPARNLSGGQQQRLCLARTLSLEPKVLQLDEPTSGLDPISTARIEEALEQLKRKLAIILVTNNVKQAARASDRTAFLFFGELVECGSTEELFTTPRDKRTADYISGRLG